MTKNIHDKNFAQLLSERSFFIDFLKTYLPPDVQKKIQWDSVKLYKMGGKHVEAKTQLSFVADIIYLAKIDDTTGMLWTHFEHQTTADRFMLLRTINYQSAELLQYIKTNKVEKLPPIISIIYHQGEKPYPYDLELSSIFDSLGVKYFAKPILVDLPIIPDEILKKHPHGPIELILKYVRMKGFPQRFEELIKGLRAVEGEPRQIVLKYLIESANIPKDIFTKTILENLPEDKELIMTPAEQWKQEGLEAGRQQGMQQGVQQGKQEGIQQGILQAKLQIAREMLNEGHSIREVQKLTKLSESEIAVLLNKMH